MPDDRTYIKLHDGMPENHKIVGLSDAAFRLYIEALCWCSRNQSDGKMPPAALRRLGSVKAQKEIGAAGLLHVDEHGSWVIHDYLEHQRSKEQVEAMKEQRRSAGRSGGLAKAKRDAKQVAKQMAKQNASKTLAVSEEVLRTSQTEAEETSGSPADPPRIDVEQTCSRLAEWIERNGSKKPAITQGWRDAARLLLDRDARSLDESLRLIDWCQRSEFWRANILSMPKFREKYDQMRLQAVAQSQPTPERRVGAHER